MTLQDLYQHIGGDYEQALRVLRVEKLIDKHIRKLPKNGVVDALLKAGEALEPAQMFEAAHAVKGICSNLGLTGIAEAASDIADEYRTGNERKLTNAQVSEMLERIGRLYAQVAQGIAEYEAAGK